MTNAHPITSLPAITAVVLLGVLGLAGCNSSGAVEDSSPTNDLPSASADASESSAPIDPSDASTDTPSMDPLYPGASVQRGLPEGLTVSQEPGELGIGWSSDGSQLLVTTFGSSSCPLVVSELVTTSPTALELDFEYAGGEICTSDFAPTTTVLPAPEGTDTSNVVGVVVGHFTPLVTVPPARDPIEYGWLPSTAE